jgi:hypothetical protein
MIPFSPYAFALSPGIMPAGGVTGHIKKTKYLLFRELYNHSQPFKKAAENFD